jgi:anaerobic selenocysteine-containing dehydrogenase
MTTRTVARQCTLCEAHCGIRVTVEDDRVQRIEGDPDDVLSKGYICPKATALADLHHDPDRLRQPHRRVGEGFEPIGWDEAIALAGRELRRIRHEHGRNALGMYLGNPAAHSPSVIYGLLLRTLLVTRHFYSASSVDQFPQEFVAWQMFGHNTLLPVVDIDRTDHLLILGANPAVSNGSISTMPDARGRIRDVRDRGGRVVVVDPRRTETARIADEHVAVLPGGDPYLLLGMLHVLFAEGLTDAGRLEGGLAGWAELTRLAARLPPEQAAPLAGVDADTIVRLARQHAEADSAVAYARIGVCHHVTGAVTHWLVNCLNAVTGNLDRAGGQMWTTPPVDPVPLLKRTPVTNGRWHGRVNGLPELRSELPVVGLADEMLTPGDGQLRGMITYAGNPVLSAPGGPRLDEAFASLDFHVAIDLYVTETSRHADLILPPVSPLEREEFDVLFPMFSVRNNARYNRAVFDPPADGREDWEILAALVSELLPLAPRPVRRAARAVMGLADPLRIAAAGIALGPHGLLRQGRRGLTLRRVRDTPGGVDLGPLESRLPGRIATRDRRVRLAPPRLVAEAGRLLDEILADPGREGRAGQGPNGDAAAAEFDLRLIGRRHLRSNNSWLHNVPAMVKGRDRCTVLMHPEDAVARGLEDRQVARVTSPVGELEVPVEVSDEIRIGTVAIPHGWGHDVDGVGWRTAREHAGANVNVLTDPTLVDRLTGNGALNATRVRVAPVEVAVTDRRPARAAAT